MTTTITATEILALPIHAEHDGLIVMHRTWAKGADDNDAAQSALAADDHHAYIAALGTPKMVTLTADGRGAVADWCRCESVPMEDWVRYERWTAEGRTAHGYVHTACRRITQTG